MIDEGGVISSNARGVCELALKFRRYQGAHGESYGHQPDSGNSNVRDENGAYGNMHLTLRDNTTDT